jgi:hypothetical protein
MGLTLVVMFLPVAIGVQAVPAPDQAAACPASPVAWNTVPPDPDADPVGPARWYINSDRTIWAGPVPADGWPQGGHVFTGDKAVRGQKTYWVRPQGERLMITGRRLDGEGAVEATIPCCYTSGFQIVALHFPASGCWEVSANAGVSEIRFVTWVKP